jgi:hypothetical protein
MDFAKNMGIPLPQRLDWNQDNRFDDDLDANEAIAWLNGTYGHDVQTGPQLGWQTIDAAKAVEMANAGFVVVAGWQNLGGIGHMALVRPDSTDVNNIRIAQAGGSNFTSGSLADGFGDLKPIQYFFYRAPRDGSTKI